MTEPAGTDGKALFNPTGIMLSTSRKGGLQGSDYLETIVREPYIGHPVGYAVTTDPYDFAANETFILHRNQNRQHISLLIEMAEMLDVYRQREFFGQSADFLQYLPFQFFIRHISSAGNSRPGAKILVPFQG